MDLIQYKHPEGIGLHSKDDHDCDKNGCKPHLVVDLTDPAQRYELARKLVVALDEKASNNRATRISDGLQDLIPKPRLQEPTGVGVMIGRVNKAGKPEAVYIRWTDAPQVGKPWISRESGNHWAFKSLMAMHADKLVVLEDGL